MSNDSVLRRLRRQHELRVLATLVDRGPCSRRELEDVTGLSRTTMSAIVADLVRRRTIVDDVQRPASGRGRPATLLRLNPRAASAVGLEIGRGHLSVAVVDIARTVLVHHTEPMTANGDPAVRIDAVTALMDRVTREHDLVLDGLAAAGIGLWGQHPDPAVDNGEPSGDLVVSALVEQLSRSFGLPVTWDNNVRLAAVAEARAVESPPCPNLVYVALSHGVGSGVVVNGTLARGAAGTAGEIGHVSVDPSGPPCWCGNRGCLENYLSVDAVVRRAAAVSPDVVDLGSLLAALNRRDGGAMEVVERSAEFLGRALSAVTTMLDPHRVVVGGELAELGEFLLGPIRTALGRQKLSIRNRRLELGTAKITRGAAAVGAALVALDQHGSFHNLAENTRPHGS